MFTEPRWRISLSLPWGSTPGGSCGWAAAGTETRAAAHSAPTITRERVSQRSRTHMVELLLVVSALHLAVGRGPGLARGLPVGLLHDPGQELHHQPSRQQAGVFGRNVQERVYLHQVKTHHLEPLRHA